MWLWRSFDSVFGCKILTRLEDEKGLDAQMQGTWELYL